MGTSKKTRIPAIIAKTALWIAGIWIGLMVIIQLVLSPAVLTKTANKIAAEFVDGEISFGKAYVSVLKHFPKVTLSLEDFTITYPAERFDSLERAGVQGHMLYHGTGETADTLASFKELSASLRLLPLVKGEFHIPHVSLVQPRIFAHSYNEGTANWNMFRLGDSEEEEDGSTSIPVISLGHISLEDHPHIVYTDSKDTLFAMVDLAKLHFDGKLKTNRMSKAKIGLRMDSLFVAGRMGRDTVAMGLDMLHIHEHRHHMDINAHAKAFMATRAFGRMQVPIDISGAVSFPKDTVTAISLENFRADIATVPFYADADIRLYDGRTGVEGTLGIRECKLQNVLSDYLSHFIPEAGMVETDAIVSLKADISGCYDHATGALPDIKATLDVPESAIAYDPFPHDIRLGLTAKAETDDKGRINVDIEDAAVNTVGMKLLADAGARDLLGDDPLLNIDGSLTASFDSLQTFIPDTMNVQASGRLAADIKGNARMSHLNLYNFSRADLTGELSLKDIVLNAPDDTISVNIDTVGIILGPETRTSRRERTDDLLRMNWLTP